MAMIVSYLESMAGHLCDFALSTYSRKSACLSSLLRAMPEVAPEWKGVQCAGAQFSVPLRLEDFLATCINSCHFVTFLANQSTVVLGVKITLEITPLAFSRGCLHGVGYGKTAHSGCGGTAYKF